MQKPKGTILASRTLLGIGLLAACPVAVRAE